MTPEDLKHAFTANKWVIDVQTKGLGDDESVLQAGFRANCLNWVVGHIVVHRDEVLRALGAQPLLDRTGTRMYARDSEPIHGPECPHVPLEVLLQLVDRSQETIVASLDDLDPSALDRPVGDGARTLGEWLRFLAWHETYHCGQTDVLRQLAGTDDKVI